MGNNDNVASIRFGAFELQPSERRLLAGGKPVIVGPRAYDVLTILVERAGGLVTKGELLDRAWPNLVVEENNLQVQVSALRKILGDEAIVTVPGHGYRFTLEAVRDATTTATAAKHNLPHQVSSFVGRQREIVGVRELLGKSRLLTLVGLGGIGKTRLALQAVADLAGDFPDGVWLVEFAPLADTRLVTQAVASVLGVKEVPGRPLLEALVANVEERSLLLMFDSCEHFVQECAKLAKQLLQCGSGLKVLATSREPLGLAGEVNYPVPALAMPKSDKAITLAALSQYEAVHLFIDRASDARPAFHLTHQNAAAVAEICRRLDGIPLAIELAAARVRVLSVEKIAERLRDRFQLLTRGDPTALPHQQTLRALIDWSHALLTSGERRLFCRLAVFPGSFTLEAAEDIGAGGDIAEADVLDLLARLVEKSMVVVEAMGERYRLLDTVREYAQERLEDAGEGDRARARHLASYFALAEKAEPDLQGGPAQGAWLARLDLEHENFLAAHAWGGHSNEAADLGLRLVYAVRNYWLHRGLFDLGYRLTTEALARAPVQESSLIRCKALLSAANLAFCVGRYEAAQAHIEESHSVAQKVGVDAKVRAAVHHMLGIVLVARGKMTEAQKHLQEALALARALEDQRALSRVLADLAELYRLEGNPDRAEPLLEEALNLARASGSMLLSATILLNLAAVSIARRSGDRARAMLLEALSMVSTIGSVVTGIDLLEKTAGLAALSGEWRCAAQLCGAADAQNQMTGNQREPMDEVFLSSLMAEARDRLGAAAFAAAEAAGRTMSYDTALTEARASLEGGRILQTTDRVEVPRGGQAL